MNIKKRQNKSLNSEVLFCMSSKIPNEIILFRQLFNHIVSCIVLYHIACPKKVD